MFKYLCNAKKIIARNARDREEHEMREDMLNPPRVQKISASTAGKQGERKITPKVNKRLSWCIKHAPRDREHSDSGPRTRTDGAQQKTSNRGLRWRLYRTVRIECVLTYHTYIMCGCY